MTYVIIGIILSVIAQIINTVAIYKIELRIDKIEADKTEQNA